LVSLKPGGKSEIKLKAHAKINVGLRIGGRRADGYHEIWSILQEIDLRDEISLREAPDFVFSAAGETSDLPVDDQNLCVRAARLLQAETGCRRGAHLELDKRIPIGAGLGGGSSDAASVLKGLNRLWGLGLNQAALIELAGQLGSDVPFFILGGCCVATGRGEILRKIDPIIRDALIVIAPKVHIDTAWAYKNIKNYRLTSKLENIKLMDLKKADVLRLLGNDFEPLVFSRHPALGVLKERLLQAGAYYASLSGSGSSIYGVFHSEESARRAFDEFQVEGRKYLLK